MGYYKQLRKTLNKIDLVPVDEDLYQHVDTENDWYTSIYYYSEEQYQEFKRRGSIRGIKDVQTNKLIWDFDSADNISLARTDAIVLCDRLIAHGAEEENLHISFSGNKGFGVELHTDKKFTVERFKNITGYFAGDLATYDRVVNDHARAIRLLYTRNLKSNLFKIPLKYNQLTDVPLEFIKTKAQDLNNIKREEFVYEVFGGFDDSVYELGKKEEKKQKEVNIEVNGIDWSRKPKHLTNCRWALQNGYFKEGNRSNVLLCLAASYKNIGYDKEDTYGLLKAVTRKQAVINSNVRFPNDELYNNVVNQVYSEGWQGGQFSCKNPGWLQDYCQGLGEHACTHSEENVTSFEGMFDLFESYATNVDKNILYTGIAGLDKKMKLMVGTSNAILAPPSVGKSSIMLQILNHNSKQKINSICFSYDMFHAAVTLRMIQRHFGLQQDNIYDLWRNKDVNAERINEIKTVISEEYKHCHFCFTAGQAPEDIRKTILDTEDKTGEKVKLIFIDYNELVKSSLVDPTAAGAEVAQKLRQIANEQEVCVVTLLQPAKLFSTPADEITNFNAAKGSSAIVQSLTLMLGCARPGFNPRDPSTDRYFNITCLKNRNGTLFSEDFAWNGLRGEIFDLSSEDRNYLRQIREKRDIAKEAESPFGRR
jgi:hypothetical protein